MLVYMVVQKPAIYNRVKMALSISQDSKGSLATRLRCGEIFN